MTTKLSPSEMTRFDKDTAKIVRALFDEKINEANRKATNGDNAAAVEFMKLLTAQNWALRRLGMMVSDSGRLVKFKPWDGKS